MIITVYGPAEPINHGWRQNTASPRPYPLQRIVIDQLQRRIESVTAAGERTNLFDYRDKENDIFLPVEPGVNTVIYDGSFDFDITLVQQRSEPLWI